MSEYIVRTFSMNLTIPPRIKLTNPEGQAITWNLKDLEDGGTSNHLPPLKELWSKMYEVKDEHLLYPFRPVQTVHSLSAPEVYEMDDDEDGEESGPRPMEDRESDISCCVDGSILGMTDYETLLNELEKISQTIFVTPSPSGDDDESYSSSSSSSALGDSETDLDLDRRSDLGSFDLDSGHESDSESDDTLCGVHPSSSSSGNAPGSIEGDDTNDLIHELEEENDTVADLLSSLHSPVTRRRPNLAHIQSYGNDADDENDHSGSGDDTFDFCDVEGDSAVRHPRDFTQSKNL